MTEWQEVFPDTNFSNIWWPMQPQLLKYRAETLQVTNFIMLFQFQPKSFFFPNKLISCLLKVNQVTQVRYSLCTDAHPPSGKIGRGDVCESPTIIVFPFPRNVGDSL